MGPGDDRATSVRSSHDELDMLAQYARQVREDRRWEREQRRRQHAAIAAFLVIAAVSITILVRTRLGDEPVTSGLSAGASATASTGSGPSASSGASSAPAGASPSPSPAASRPSASPVTQAVRLYGAPRSGLAWHSGIWTGGLPTTSKVDRAGTWRGRPMDFATVYPPYDTWTQIRGSNYVIENVAGFRGRLAVGLPLLPKDRKGRWSDILDGSHDDVFGSIAQQLVAGGHRDAAIRMGVEANGYWFPWSVTLDTVDEFKASFRRIEKIMSAVSKDFTFWVDLNAGTVLTGSHDRLAPLVEMFPGTDVVDGISMDHYNRYKLLAKDEATWRRAIAPSWAPGLRDGIDFARAHGIGFAVPEWGLDGVQGPGDSVYFMEKMHSLFVDNADVLVYENYFSEPNAYIKGDLFQTSQNPQSAAYYRQHWGKRR